MVVPLERPKQQMKLVTMAKGMSNPFFNVALSMLLWTTWQTRVENGRFSGFDA
jgi:hypothetical protein